MQPGVWLNSTVVGNFEAQLAAESTVTKHIGRGGQVMAGAETAEVVAVD